MCIRQGKGAVLRQEYPIQEFLGVAAEQDGACEVSICLGVGTREGRAGYRIPSMDWRDEVDLAVGLRITKYGK